jgi:hypothetical protein
MTVFGYLENGIPGVSIRDLFTGSHSRNRRRTCVRICMSTIPYEAPVLNEEVWNTWLAKMARQEKAAHRKLGAAVLIALSLTAIGLAVFHLGF